MEKKSLGVLVFGLVLLSLFSFNFASAVVPGQYAGIILKGEASINFEVLETFCNPDSCISQDSEYSKSILFKVYRGNVDGGFSLNYNKLNDYYSISVYDRHASQNESPLFEAVPTGLNLLLEYDVLEGITSTDLEEITQLIKQEASEEWFSKSIYFKPASCLDSNSYNVDYERAGLTPDTINWSQYSINDSAKEGWLTMDITCGSSFMGWDNGCPRIKYVLGMACIADSSIPDYATLTALSFDSDSSNNYLTYSLYGLVVVILLLVAFFVFKKKK